MTKLDDESTAKELFDLGFDLIAGSAIGAVDFLKLGPTLFAGAVIGSAELVGDFALALLPKKPRN